MRDSVDASLGSVRFHLLLHHLLRLGEESTVGVWCFASGQPVRALRGGDLHECGSELEEVDGGST